MTMTWPLCNRQGMRSISHFLNWSLTTSHLMTDSFPLWVTLSHCTFCWMSVLQHLYHDPQSVSYIFCILITSYELPTGCEHHCIFSQMVVTWHLILWPTESEWHCTFFWKAVSINHPHDPKRVSHIALFFILSHLILLPIESEQLTFHLNLYCIWMSTGSMKVFYILLSFLILYRL